MRVVGAAENGTEAMDLAVAGEALSAPAVTRRLIERFTATPPSVTPGSS